MSMHMASGDTSTVAAAAAGTAIPTVHSILNGIPPTTTAASPPSQLAPSPAVARAAPVAHRPHLSPLGPASTFSPTKAQALAARRRAAAEREDARLWAGPSEKLKERPDFDLTFTYKARRASGSDGGGGRGARGRARLEPLMTQPMASAQALTTTQEAKSPTNRQRSSSPPPAAVSSAAKSLWDDLPESFDEDAPECSGRSQPGSMQKALKEAERKKIPFVEMIRTPLIPTSPAAATNHQQEKKRAPFAMQRSKSSQKTVAAESEEKQQDNAAHVSPLHTPSKKRPTLRVGAAADVESTPIKMKSPSGERSSRKAATPTQKSPAKAGFSYFSNAAAAASSTINEDASWASARKVEENKQGDGSSGASFFLTGVPEDADASAPSHASPTRVGSAPHLAPSSPSSSSPSKGVHPPAARRAISVALTPAQAARLAHSPLSALTPAEKFARATSPIKAIHLPIEKHPEEGPTMKEYDASTKLLQAKANRAAQEIVVPRPREFNLLKGTLRQGALDIYATDSALAETLAIQRRKALARQKHLARAQVLIAQKAHKEVARKLQWAQEEEDRRKKLANHHRIEARWRAEEIEAETLARQERRILEDTRAEESSRRAIVDACRPDDKTGWTMLTGELLVAFLAATANGSDHTAAHSTTGSVCSTSRHPKSWLTDLIHELRNKREWTIGELKGTLEGLKELILAAEAQKKLQTGSTTTIATATGTAATSPLVTPREPASVLAVPGTLIISTGSTRATPVPTVPSSPSHAIPTTRISAYSDLVSRLLAQRARMHAQSIANLDQQSKNQQRVKKEEKEEHEKRVASAAKAEVESKKAKSPSLAPVKPPKDGAATAQTTPPPKSIRSRATSPVRTDSTAKTTPPKVTPPKANAREPSPASRAPLAAKREPSPAGRSAMPSTREPPPAHSDATSTGAPGPVPTASPSPAAVDHTPPAKVSLSQRLAQKRQKSAELQPPASVGAPVGATNISPADTATATPTTAATDQPAEALVAHPDAPAEEPTQQNAQGVDQAESSTKHQETTPSKGTEDVQAKSDAEVPAANLPVAANPPTADAPPAADMLAADQDAAHKATAASAKAAADGLAAAKAADEKAKADGEVAAKLKAEQDDKARLEQEAKAKADIDAAAAKAKAEQDVKLAAEKATADKLASDKASSDRLAAEKAAEQQVKVDTETAAKLKAELDAKARAESDATAVKLKMEQAGKLATSQTADQKPATEQPPADRIAAEKLPADQAAPHADPAATMKSKEQQELADAEALAAKQSARKSKKAEEAAEKAQTGSNTPLGITEAPAKQKPREEDHDAKSKADEAARAHQEAETKSKLDAELAAVAAAAKLKAEQEAKLAGEKAAADTAAADTAAGAAAKLKSEQAAQLAAEKATTADKIATDKAAADHLTAEKAKAEEKAKVEAETAAAKLKAEQDTKLAAAEKAASEKRAADHAATEKLAAQKAAEERAKADNEAKLKAEQDAQARLEQEAKAKAGIDAAAAKVKADQDVKLAAEKATADKLASEKLAGEQRAAEKSAAEKKMAADKAKADADAAAAAKSKEQPALAGANALAAKPAEPERKKAEESAVEAKAKLHSDEAGAAKPNPTAGAAAPTTLKQEPSPVVASLVAPAAVAAPPSAAAIPVATEAAAAAALPDTAAASAPLDDSDDPDALRALVVGLMDAEQFAEARPLAERELELRESLLGSGLDVRLLPCLENCATIFEVLADPASALPFLFQYLQIVSSVHGRAHTVVADALMRMGEALVALQEGEDAFNVFVRCYLIRREQLGHEHAETQQARECVASLTDPEFDLDQLVLEEIPLLAGESEDPTDEATRLPGQEHPLTDGEAAQAAAMESQAARQHQKHAAAVATGMAKAVPHATSDSTGAHPTMIHPPHSNPKVNVEEDEASQAIAQANPSLASRSAGKVKKTAEEKLAKKARKEARAAKRAACAAKAAAEGAPNDPSLAAVDSGEESS